MKRSLLMFVLIGLSASSALAQGRFDPCSREKREAERHYYSALRNQGGKGYLDAGEQRTQQQLQARYDACVSRSSRRYYDGPRSYESFGPSGFGRCSREKHEAERHYYAALRNQGGKGYLDAAEQRIQQQLQARYDACLGRFGR